MENLTCAEYYKNGVADGIWDVFHEDGRPDRKDLYQNGQLTNPSLIQKRKLKIKRREIGCFPYNRIR
jgi:antitoxin component YwqK of YwqJK toxin-antitoxin module